MSAPEKVLGQAIRSLKVAPSEAWIAGFDAGYDATVTVAKNLLKVCEYSKKLTRKIDDHLLEARRTISHLEESIGKFAYSIEYESIVSERVK